MLNCRGKNYTPSQFIRILSNAITKPFFFVFTFNAINTYAYYVMHVFQVEDKRRQLNVCNYLTDTPFDSILKAIQHTTHTHVKTNDA